MHLRGHGLPLNASDATPAMCDTDRVREKERANCVSMTRVASGATQLVKSDTFCSWSAFDISALSWERHPRLRPQQTCTSLVSSCASYARCCPAPPTPAASPASSAALLPRLHGHHAGISRRPTSSQQPTIRETRAYDHSRPHNKNYSDLEMKGPARLAVITCVDGQWRLQRPASPSDHCRRPMGAV